MSADPTDSPRRTRGRRGGGREARLAERAARAAAPHAPFLTRTMRPFEVLSEEGLEIIEHNADTILEEVGIEFRDHPEALRLLADAGADVDGSRVRFPRGLCRQIVSENAPAVYTQHARNPEHSVLVGGDATVFAPNYGSPFVTDLDRGRRYATLEDFQNLVKLAYLAPALHHSGGTVCEPVDLPVNKRHLDMVYSHIRYSDKPFMGSVTHPERAADTVPQRAFGRRQMADVFREQVDLRAGANYRGTGLGAIHRAIRADLYIVADLDIADLWNLETLVPDTHVSESVRSNDRTAVDENAISKYAAVAHRHIRIEDAAFADACAGADVRTEVRRRLMGVTVVLVPATCEICS